MSYKLFIAGIIIASILINVTDGHDQNHDSEDSEDGHMHSHEYGWIAGPVIGGVALIAMIIFILIRCYIAKKQGVPFLRTGSAKTGIQPTVEPTAAVYPMKNYPPLPPDYISPSKGDYADSKQPKAMAPPDYNTVYGNDGPPPPPPPYTYSDPAYPPQKY